LISNHFRDSVGGPEKAGVGGSIPSLATNNFNNLQIAKNIQISSREQYAYNCQPDLSRLNLAKVAFQTTTWKLDVARFSTLNAGGDEQI
jgi:hypothetical protein